MPSVAALFLSGATLAVALSQAHCLKIHWRACDFNGTQPIQCGNLSVPLDYTDATSSATVNLELVKVPAVESPSKGSILFNFGGPGAESQRTMAALADELQTLTGGHNDLIAFDPRGTGNTMVVSCYKTDTERLVAAYMSPVWTNSSDTALGTEWAMGQNLAEACAENAADVGSLVGTAFAARDMMQIVDALDEDGMLRFWGLSYGTVLGATVAAMFPDRMDRIVLDGVVNPYEYYSGYDVEMATDTDKTFAAFFEGCLAAPDRCALARDNATAADLQDTVFGLLDALKYNPIPLAGQLIDYSTVKEVIFGNLYSPSTWPQLAGGLNGLVTGNMTAVINFAASLASQDLGIAKESLPGIKCADKAVRSSSLAAVRPVVEQLYGLSRVAGDKLSRFVVQCAQWELDAKERYSGDFRVRTRKPMLLIGNTFDPATPLVSARNVSAAFDGSVLLQHDGYGHSSLAQPSICTMKALRNYFIHGTTPEQGTICEVDTTLFSNDSWRDVLPPIRRVRRSVSERDDDAALLWAASALGNRLLRPTHFA